MFVSKIACLALAALATSLTAAQPVAQPEPEPRRHHHETRGSYSGRATFYSVNNSGAPACGGSANDGQHVVAIAGGMYGDFSRRSKWCGRQITITNKQNGKTRTAKIVDACPGCKGGSLDLSPSLFSALNNGNMDEGVFPISWH